VLAAHHAGLADAVGYLDEHLGARRGHGGVQHVAGQGVLAVGFDHRTSREGDPLLHTHLVIANRVQGPDGRWTAVDGRDLYRHRLAADAIYRATYQRKLVRTLGVEWTAADTYGNRELQGMPEELVLSFSKRTGQIDAELDRMIEDGRERTPRLVKWAVHATRKPKQHETPDTLYDRWRQEAAERGHDADTLVRQVTARTASRDQDWTVSVEVAGRLFDGLAGPDGLTGHASTFTRPDVLVALGAGLAGVGRSELEALADRFLVERAVSVVADRTLEERRWSTPELLAVEQQLVTSATGWTGEQAAMVSHQAVREALAAHPTAGTDQQAMVRDLCQGGQGVALVVGRAGTGKTFALGIARHAWQLEGYRLVASAPTGIATMSLQGEGFEDVATCDRLLGDLERGREQLDARTVLVVDEAGMVGSRKLARLLEHAQHAQAKVVLVGDDRQLAPIDAGGGFRALRLRLGASELTENRRQHHAWEREALELVRSGLVEEAVAAYQAHDRVVAADSKPAATLALLQDWWAALQQADHDPAQDVIVLAARRAEVDRLNTACQELLAAQGRLGFDRLQMEDRQLAVGDRVVCGHNAIAELGVANGSRGTITDLDPHARTLTIRLDGGDGREVTVPRSYLDGRGRGERNRRVDLAYATTGHRAQGLTRGRALVRLTGIEDVNWLYVQLSRARQDTRLYAVVGPEPHGVGELDPPDREQPDGYVQLAQALSRVGSQTLAIDTPSSPDLQRLSTAELRAERDRLRRQLDQAPRDRSRELARATVHRQQAEQVVAAHQSATARQAAGMLRFVRRGGDHHAGMPGGLAVAAQQANRAHDRERELPQHQHRRDGWLEANGHLGPQYRQVVRTLAWQRRATGLAIEADRPGYVLEALGAGAGVDPGKKSLAAGRWRDRGVPAHLSDRRPGPGAWPRALCPRPAGRPAASPHGHRAGPGQTMGRRPHPPAPADQRAPHPAATSRAAWPTRPGAGGRLAPAERSLRWPGPDRGPLTTRIGPVARCGRSARPTSRPSSPTSPVTTRMSWWRAPAPIGQWSRSGSGPRSAGRAARPKPGGGACVPMSGPPGSRPYPGGWPPPWASGPLGESLAACWPPGLG
jgi:hypothetical protein